MDKSIVVESFDFTSLRDISQSIDLLNRVFGPGTMDAALWNWKYDQNPFGRPVGWCAKRGNEIVAVRLLWPWMLAPRGEGEKLAYQAVDVATDESCRRGGLFSRLNAHAMDWVVSQGSFIFNFPNFSRHSYAGYAKLGFYTLASQRWLLAPVTPFFLRYSARNQNFGQSGSLIDSLSGNESSVLWDRAALEWRFVNHPRNRYERFTSSDGDTVLFSIIKKRGVRVARVAYSEGSFERRFLGKFFAYLVSRGVFLIIYNGFNTNFGRLLSSISIKFNSKDGIHCCFYPGRDALEGSQISFELAVLDYA